MWTRIRLTNHFSVTVVLPALWRSSSTRLPVLYADDTKSRRSAADHTGVLMFNPQSVWCGCVHSVSPFDGSMPEMRSPPKTTSCGWPSTSMRIGDAGAGSPPPRFHATAPVS